MNTETLKATEATETTDPVAPADRDALPLWERLVTLTVIMVPPAALIAAMVFAWGWGGLRLIDLALLVGMYIVTGLGVTIGYHRLFTHRSFETGRVMTTIVGVHGSMACEGTILRWVATHRCHHHHSDEAADPHSPHRHGTGAIATLRGFWDAQVGWMFKPLEPNIAR